MRSGGRRTDEMRPISFEPNFHRPHCTLASFGETKVICYASIEERVPPWLVGAEQGWLTAEYSMLPTSAYPRQPREKNLGGRAIEIQRLIGRALRACLDLKALPPITIRIDCDVLVADGGTRTAGISGAFLSLTSLLYAERQRLDKFPLRRQVSAVSVGILNGSCYLDLDYREDSSCEVDANIVKTSDGSLVDVSVSAEKDVFSEADLQEMLVVAGKGLEKIFEIQRAHLPKGLLLD